MTFNQKIVTAITVLAIGITAAITFVFFEPPYASNFWISYAVLTFSEALFGIFWIRQIAKEDSVLPLSIGVWGINALYFIFALIATLLTGMDEKYFILLQTGGFAVYVIVHLFFRMAEHHVEELSKDDIPEQKIERAKVTWR